MTLVYASPGLFDMGGIARYGRYQVAALRELTGSDSISVHSMLSRDAAGFDESFDVNTEAGGTGLLSKLRFVKNVATACSKPKLFWAGLINYAPLVYGLSRINATPSVVNIYGLEVWSNKSLLKKQSLQRSWVVSDCHATLDYALDHSMARPERSCVIHDPVDLNVFHPGPPDPEVARRYQLAMDGRFRVMFLGRLKKEAAHKNPDLLIRAFAKATLPPKSELVIAGSGDQMKPLKELAVRLGVGEQVRFLGRVPDKDLADVYRCASLFVLVSHRTSRGGEGIPLTPLEAAACGVPIVVGNEDGSRESCIHGESGFILPSRDEQALQNIITQCAQNSHRSREVGAKAAAHMKEHFSFQRFVREHKALLQRLRVLP